MRGVSRLLPLQRLYAADGFCQVKNIMMLIRDEELDLRFARAGTPGDHLALLIEESIVVRLIELKKLNNLLVIEWLAEVNNVRRVRHPHVSLCERLYVLYQNILICLYLLLDSEGFGQYMLEAAA